MGRGGRGILDILLTDGTCPESVSNLIVKSIGLLWYMHSHRHTVMGLGTTQTLSPLECFHFCNLPNTLFVTGIPNTPFVTGILNTPLDSSVSEYLGVAEEYLTSFCWNLS